MQRRDRTASLVDLYVARRVRQQRLRLGLSQEALAERLGLTVQQIQKYEHGANRISASRLVAIGIALETPLRKFYAGAEASRRLASLVQMQGDDLPLMLDICDLLIAWSDADSDVQRRRIAQLVRVARQAQHLKDRHQVSFLPRPARPAAPARRVPQIVDVMPFRPQSARIPEPNQAASG